MVHWSSTRIRPFFENIESNIITSPKSSWEISPGNAKRPWFQDKNLAFPLQFLEFRRMLCFWIHSPHQNIRDTDSPKTIELLRGGTQKLFWNQAPFPKITQNLSQKWTLELLELHFSSIQVHKVEALTELELQLRSCSLIEIIEALLGRLQEEYPLGWWCESKSLYFCWVLGEHIICHWFRLWIEVVNIWKWPYTIVNANQLQDQTDKIWQRKHCSLLCMLFVSQWWFMRSPGPWKESKIVGKQCKSKESSDTSTAFRKTCEPTKTGSWVRTTPKTKSLVGSGPAADRDRPRGARQGLILILLRGLIASPKRRPVQRVSSARSRRAPTVWGPVSPGRGRLGRVRVASDPRSAHE